MMSFKISEEISNLFSCLSKTYKFRGRQNSDLGILISNLVDEFCAYNFNLLLDGESYNIYFINVNDEHDSKSKSKSVTVNLSQVSEDYINLFLNHNWRKVNDLDYPFGYQLEDAIIGIAVYQASKDLEFEVKREVFKVLPFGKKNQSKNFVIRLSGVSGELPRLRYPYYFIGTMHQYSLEAIFSTFQKRLNQECVESEPLVSDQGLMAMQHLLDVEEPLDVVLSRLYDGKSNGWKISDDSYLKLSVPALGGEHDER